MSHFASRPGARLPSGPEISETVLLDNLSVFLDELANGSLADRLPLEKRREARTLWRQVHQVSAQVTRGIHINPRRKNPVLVLYGNPPMRARHGAVSGMDDIKIRLRGLIGVSIHQIKYEHAEDGHPYVHDFDDPHAGLWAATWHGRPVLFIENHNGLPLWQDFK